MSEIVIKIKDWKELHKNQYIEQFEVYIDGEKIPRVDEFGISVKNHWDRRDKYDVREGLTYTLKQHLPYENWEKP